MGKKTKDIMAFRCVAPKLRHDISALGGAGLTMLAYAASYNKMVSIDLWKQFIVLFVTYVSYVAMIRFATNVVFALNHPTKVIISKEGAYIQGHMKQSEIIKHSGYTIIEGTLIQGMGYVDGAIAVNLKLKNIKKTVFIANTDADVLENLKNIG